MDSAHLVRPGQVTQIRGDGGETTAVEGDDDGTQDDEQCRGSDTYQASIV